MNAAVQRLRMAEPHQPYPSTMAERKEVQDQLMRLVDGQARIEQQVIDLRADVSQIVEQRRQEADVLRWAAGWRSFFRWVGVTVGLVTAGAAATGQLGWIKPLFVWIGR